MLIGAATEALCSPAITREPFGITPIRGRQQAEQPWIVTGATAAGARPVRCDIPFVGRIDELALLETTISLVRAGHSGVVSIVGEAGCGKSRLADHIVTKLADEAIILETACSPYGETSLWSPLRNGLATLLALGPDAGPDEVRGNLEQRSEELWSLKPGDELLERLLGVIAYLFGHPSDLDDLDPAGTRDRITGVVTEAMRCHAQTRMTVLWVDNLQWADPSVRDLLAVVVRSLADLPFLLITSQRPDDDLLWPPPLLDRSLLLRVPLGPLSIGDAATLVRVLLERDGGPDLSVETLVDDLVDRGGCNPLYLVELAALAVSAPSQPHLPGSLRALIAAAPRSAASRPPGHRRQRRGARAERIGQGSRSVRRVDAHRAPGHPAPGSERELHPYRQRFVDMFTTLRRHHGVRFFLAHNMTVTPANLGQVAEVVRDCHAMGFGMFSFQPAAFVGDDRRWHEDYGQAGMDEVWAEIERGAGTRLEHTVSSTAMSGATAPRTASTWAIAGIRSSQR